LTTIVIDVNEPKEFDTIFMAIGARIKREQIKSEEDEVRVGDFTSEDRMWIVERKTAEDYYNSLLVDKRFFEQMVKISAYPHPYLIIEGNFQKILEKTQAKAYMLSTLVKIQFKLGVRVLYSPNRYWTCKLVTWIDKYSREDSTFEIPVRRNAAKLSVPQRILIQIPGIGKGLAEKLLVRFGNPRNVFNATPEELLEVKGVSIKTIESIFNVCGRKVSIDKNYAKRLKRKYERSSKKTELNL